MITYAAKGDASELPVDAKKLDILLRNAVSVASNKNRYVVYKALYLAKATDGTDVDAKIAEFSTTRDMIPDIRYALIRDVLRKREDPAIVPTLLDYARSTDDAKAAQAAIEAVRFMATDEHFSEFIEIIQSTSDSTIRKAAEGTAEKIIEKSTAKERLGEILAKAHDNAFSDAVRHSMLRLLAGIGSERALRLATESLESDSNENRIAAIVTLGKWKDQTGFKALIDYIESGPEIQLRGRAFDSAIGYASDSEQNLEENWELIAGQSKTQEEQIKLIRGVASSQSPAPWSYGILENIVSNSDDDKAVDMAEKAIGYLKEVEKTKTPGQQVED